MRQDAAKALYMARDIIAQHGLSQNDVFPLQTVFRDRAGRARIDGRTLLTGTQPPKYRNPQTGATWSGRGPAPRWIIGQNRARFLIDTGGAALASPDPCPPT